LISSTNKIDSHDIPGILLKVVVSIITLIVGNSLLIPICLKVKLFGIEGKNLTNEHPFPQANCLQILVESHSILSLQIFATGPTFLTFNQTHYERNDLID
jgi:hypothetical protein